ncbi:type I-E CRISPR-associated protein Cse1/CasA [Rothia kristinae]|uniref:type I-E CRISPR-associated protein Cse1/CasA n=1 Tax=Rothia kristinae TaxID=37923 RepID=UPI000736E9C3|nr:type I-E CRISPR-associated protein Cse1/CasA [Rothia kristinae]KTR37911.1 hypothetical protein RSA5_06290 [Rothia kristinae]KTR58376.1 hypothetical protein SA11R_05325 [Rothia kristinae]KTR67352.1 hypothetical protein SA12R_06435 [Rothia kristinae]KTR73587.1 hypothetical protein SA15R_04130 [Rothia kristinae]KTR79673.1 hypothetical protein RSA28_07550 [Rothia kristinae]
MTREFNLIDEPWIVCTIGEETHELSLRELIENLGSIRRLAGESPTQDYAVLRVILVIFWRSHRKDEDLIGPGRNLDDWWLDMFGAAGSADPADIAKLGEPMLAYLEEHRDRFDLLHPVTPFMQVADLHTAKDEHGPIRRLIPDAESDYFTQRAGEQLEALSFAEAARYLVALQAWDYSGIKSGAIGDPRVKGGKGYPIGTGWTGRTGGVVLHGKNLAETLILNTAAASVFTERMEADLPVWEQTAQTAAPRGVETPTGPCDVLTWQIRRIRLFHEGERVTGVLVSNGDRVELQNQFADPMTGYRWSRNQSSKTTVVHMPGAHSQERTLWRGLTALLAREGVVTPRKGEHLPLQPKTIEALHQFSEHYPEELNRRQVGLELVGMIYGTNDAVVVHTVHEEIPLRLGVLLDRSPRSAELIVSSAEATAQAAVRLGQFAGMLELAIGGDYVFQEHTRDAALQELAEEFRRWLEEITPDTDYGAARDRWFETVETAVLRHAGILLRGAGPRALTGRIDADGRLTTAATAMSILRAQLRKELPRTGAAPRTQDPAQIGATV